MTDDPAITANGVDRTISRFVRRHAIPEILSGRDETRSAMVSVSMANSHTAEMRQGGPGLDAKLSALHALDDPRTAASRMIA